MFIISFGGLTAVTAEAVIVTESSIGFLVVTW